VEIVVVVVSLILGITYSVAANRRIAQSRTSSNAISFGISACWLLVSFVSAICLVNMMQ
jgi:hypothetical protein